MADSENSGDDGQELLYQIIGIIVIVFIIGNVLSNYGFDIFGNSGDLSATSTVNQTEKFSLSNSFPTGDIRLGDNVLNKKDVDVFRVPASQIIGTQSKREVGKPIEGPVDRSGRIWWRIDYENAPDGWVRQSNLTTHVWSYRLVFAFPILFSALTPFLILLSIILFALIIVVMVKSNNLYDLRQKKLELKKQKTVKDKIIEEVDEEEKMEKGDEEVADSEEDKLLGILPTDDSVPQTQDVHNKRWAKVESLINSHSVNDWKQAIIEADIILDEMLEKMSYKGQSVGEKLKQVEESDFLTLNQAWEAHKIRNRIAHKGSDYTMTRNDAERAFNLYKEVFEEFYFI